MRLKISIFLLFTIANIFSQITQEKILNSFETFISESREVVYVQLNKTTYIKNETLGFSAYLIEKGKKSIAENITNLYVTISDDKNNTIKSKLIKVKNGFANNIFQLDSTFSSGKYTFRAYTNWMLNFKERNYFEQRFQILDPNFEKEIKSTAVVKDYDLSFFPESGHLIYETPNKIGILVKDENGFGLANARGKIIDENNMIVQNFELNQVGIASAVLRPSKAHSYKIVVQHKNLIIEKDINEIEDIGFNMSIKKLRNKKVALQFRTNSNALAHLKNKTFYLVIHNGSELKTSIIKFTNKLIISKFLNNNMLFKGINIFTVFDAEKGKPILERLYFKKEGINRVTFKTSKILEQQNDSLLLEISLSDTIAINKLQNVSISVLPKSTKSNTINSTILSQFFLEPYVRGFIETPSIYFSKDSLKSQEDLDNLLITQGWSSYEWDEIFKKPNYLYRYEKGISAKVTVNSKKYDSFLIYPLKNNSLRSFKLEKSQKYFYDNELYPEDDEKYKISAIKRNKSFEPNLSLEFSPSKIPDFKIDLYSNPFKNIFIHNYEKDEIKLQKLLPTSSLNEVQVLDEVVVASNKEIIRMEKIKVRKAFSKIGFINEDTTEQNLEQYLRNRGVVVLREGTMVPGTVIPLKETGIFWMGLVRYQKSPIIIFNDRIVDTDPEFVLNYELDHIDYVEISRQGIGFDIRGAGGVINVVTNPKKRRMTRALNDKSSVFNIHKFPLTFNSPKKFYTPKYKNYNSSFFKAFGTIAWFPELKVNSKEKITLKIPLQYKGDITLFMQGIINNKSFVSDVRTIKL